MEKDTPSCHTVLSANHWETLKILKMKEKKNVKLVSGSQVENWELPVKIDRIDSSQELTALSWVFIFATLFQWRQLSDFNF